MSSDKTADSSSLERSSSAAAGVEQFLQSALYTAVQKPIDAITQLAHIPHLALVDAPDNSMWSQAGKVVGSVADFYVLSKGVGKIFSAAGIADAAMPIMKAGTTGATLALFQPVQDSGNYWSNKGQAMAVGFGTFATMAGANQVLGSSSLLGQIGKRSLAQDIAVGGLSGIPAGFANAELSSLLNGAGWAQGSDVKQSMFSYGAFGALSGAVTHVGESFKSAAAIKDNSTKEPVPSQSDTKAIQTDGATNENVVGDQTAAKQDSGNYQGMQVLRMNEGKIVGVHAFSHNQNNSAAITGEQGTGFFVGEDGSLATAHHVIAGADNIFVTASDGTVRLADVIQDDPTHDLALLKVTDAAPFAQIGDKVLMPGNGRIVATDSSVMDGPDFAKFIENWKPPPPSFAPVPIPETSDLQPGDSVVALGLPHNATNVTASAGEFEKIIEQSVPKLVADVHIEHGNSGGPLFNNRTGNLVGIVSGFNENNPSEGVARPLEPLTALISKAHAVAST